MARSKVYSNPVQARLSHADFEKFEALRRERKITMGELVRELLSKSLSEVQIDA
jgi:hypothetical protein